MGDSGGDASTSVTQINKLNFSDPLYLHSNDTTGTPITSVKLKGTENYNIWSRSMKLALSTKNKIGFINGTVVRSQTDEVLASQWDKEEFYKGISSDKFVKTQASAFATQSSNNFNKGGNNSGGYTSNNNNFSNNITSNQNLKCKKCNKTGHTIDMCFEIIGYPPSFERIVSGNQTNQSYSNNSVTNKDECCGSAPASLTNDQLMKLLILINDNDPPVDANANMAAGLNDIIDISQLNLTVGHPNETQDKAVKVGNLKLSNNVALYDVLDLKAMTIVGNGSKSGGLYMFDDHNVDILDDYSRVVWTFMLKSKDETFENVLTFVNLIQTQFNKNVKVIRSDNRTEFVNHKMDNFLRSKGIIHQTSFAHTPQQNGIVERKHRHLLNVERALMFLGSYH
ncbi:uncharacterized protein [Rutidosis leptorrhynchoides]|uniref:uncharacterized protein n=1 Tax=Rutidosis leptorrhynchoides TaxID=125765 RepID=UPI003A99A7F5